MRRPPPIKKRLDISGQRFGRLTALVPMRDQKGRCVWLCSCECGKCSIVITNCLLNGQTKSCGCLRRDRTRTANTRHGFSPYRNQKRIYKIWCGIKQRCTNPHLKGWLRYGGRGIQIDPEWLEFKNFCRWALSNGYGDKLQIDRIDPNGNYEPKNCRWVTPSEQQRNRTNNRFIAHRGESRTLSEWSEDTGIPGATIAYRIDVLGWPIKRALQTRRYI